ncbi:MAG: DUF1934 domain-containing protein [Clostridiales bacterium]|nr:DUF1934 domain-containing protein [Clostridiales bacterium]
MTQEVRISVCGVQYLDGEAQEPILDLASGTYYKKNDRQYFLYDTAEEKTGAAVKNRIRISGDCVEMTRTGGARVHMIFRSGVRCRAEYMTPAGMLPLDTFTHAVRVTETESRIAVRLEYALESDGACLAEYLLEITAESF